jgi:hypothetical protein
VGGNIEIGVAEAPGAGVESQLRNGSLESLLSLSFLICTPIVGTIVTFALIWTMLTFQWILSSAEREQQGRLSFSQTQQDGSTHLFNNSFLLPPSSYIPSIPCSQLWLTKWQRFLGETTFLDQRYHWPLHCFSRRENDVWRYSSSNFVPMRMNDKDKKSKIVVEHFVTLWCTDLNFWTSHFFFPHFY